MGMAGNGWGNIWWTKGKPFLESFPSVASGYAEVIEDGDGTHPGIGSLPWGGRVVPFEDRSGNIPCSNPKCKGGGAYIEQEVCDMIKKGEAEHEFPRKCSNPECTNFFQIKIVLRYKS